MSNGTDCRTGILSASGTMLYDKYGLFKTYFKFHISLQMRLINVLMELFGSISVKRSHPFKALVHNAKSHIRYINETGFVA